MKIKPVTFYDLTMEISEDEEHDQPDLMVMPTMGGIQ